MVITCLNCGSDRFKAGELRPSPQGGFDVVMPCSECGTPLSTIHSDDMELAKELLKFFGEPVNE
jgi:hypothetical protein